MKKTILILSAIVTISFTGCSRAEIEKTPITVEDAVSLDDEIEADTSKDVPGNDKITKAPEEIAPGEGTREEAKEEIQEEVKGEIRDEANVEIKEDANVEVAEEVILEARESIPVIFEIEGMQETMYCFLHVGNGYEILYDSDRFEYSDKDGVDTFIAENPDPAMYPYVYVSINRLENQSASNYVRKLSDTLSKSNLTFEITKDAPIGNYKGTTITAQAGSEWNSIIRSYYIIEDGKSIYTIESQYFLEASEGFGARIHAMLDTFKIK